MHETVVKKLHNIELTLSFSSFQNGDSYLVHLAARYSMDLGTLQHEVLQQLEDLRLAEWSDRAPPPPSVPTPSQGAQQQKQQNHLMINSHLGPRDDDEFGSRVSIRTIAEKTGKIKTKPSPCPRNQ